MFWKRVLLFQDSADRLYLNPQKQEEGKKEVLCDRVPKMCDENFFSQPVSIDKIFSCLRTHLIE
ncbi:UNVERIFIED_CONTAM: hypothetical protein NCL1_29785 [Trichonephila clavipes]